MTAEPAALTHVRAATERPGSASCSRPLLRTRLVPRTLVASAPPTLTTERWLMLQIEFRRSNLTTDLTAAAGETRAATAHGDFARGQRHHIGRVYVHGDFASGMRTISTPRVTGD